MARVSSFLISYFSNYYTLLRSDLAARAAPLDPRLPMPSALNYHFLSFSDPYWQSCAFSTPASTEL